MSQQLLDTCLLALSAAQDTAHAQGGDYRNWRSCICNMSTQAGWLVLPTQLSPHLYRCWASLFLASCSALRTRTRLGFAD